MIRPMLFSLICLLATTLTAQSGNWTRTGTWHMAQAHQVTEFNGRLWAIGGTNVNTDEHTFDEIRSSGDGIDWVQEVQHAPFGPRANHAVLVFNSRLWVLGGTSDALFNRLNDVWSSPDGINWTLETPAAAWAARANHSAVVFNNRMWVMGGRAPNGRNDVWSSSDGVNWTNESTAAAWDARYASACVAHNGRLWILGGQSQQTGELRDVWSSGDGANWQQELAFAPWAARSGHTAAVFNGEIVMMSGGWSFHNDIWRSSDGVNWTFVNAAAPRWDGRRGHATAVFGNRLWVFGGYYETPPLASAWLLRRDIWSSDNLSNWQFETERTNWSPRGGHGSVSFNGRLWVIGGIHVPYTETTNNAVGTAEVWSSTDGQDWTFEIEAPFGRRVGHQTLVFNNRLWVIGGYSMEMWDTMNDVWSSADGLYWELETANAQWASREAFGAQVFNGRLWVMGGVNDTGIEYRDVWSSADGKSWSLETVNPGFSRRRGFNVLTFAARMWVIGGTVTLPIDPMNPSGPKGQFPCKDVWSTDDGINWTLEAAGVAFLERGAQAAAVFGGRIWVSGGGWNFTPYNDIWTSTDGILWTMQTAAAPWPARPYHQTVAHNGSLWVIGGGGQLSPLNDVWRFDPHVAPQITSVPPTMAHVGQVYSYDIQATGDPAPYIGASGLPSWLVLNGNTLSGTPDVADAGSVSTITIHANNFGGWDSQTYQLVVDGAPQILSSPATTATAGILYQETVVVHGSGVTLSAIGLPGWLSLSGNVLSGTPAAADIGLTGVITLEAVNVHGTDTHGFQIVVQGGTPSFTSTPLTTANVASLYSYTVTVGGVPAASLSATTLPGWLSFDAATGLLSGTPLAADRSSTNDVVLVAVNAYGSDTQAFQIQVGPVLMPDPAAPNGTGGSAGCVGGPASGLPLIAALALLLRRRRK